MYIRRIKVENFRGLKSMDLQLKPGINFIIGSSNVGKSTVLKAADLVLNPTVQWWRRDILDELDFHHKKTDSPIVIELLLDCGRIECPGCKRFEVVKDEDSETCKLCEHLIYIDSEDNILTAETISAEKKGACIWLRMTATFKEAEGYVEVEHDVLGEDGTPRTSLTRPMKEWIGSLLLKSNRTNESECRLQHNSLLRRSIGETGSWDQKYSSQFKKGMNDLVEELSANEAKNALERAGNQLKLLSPLVKGNLTLGVEGARKTDLLRQVELSIEDAEDAVLPFSYQGEGLQNLTVLMLAVFGQRKYQGLRPPSSIIMIEEPEENLEPQMQRSVLRFMQTLLMDHQDNDSPEEPTASQSYDQILITTHSPYVLSSDLKLNSVLRLVKETSGEVKSIALGSIGGSKGFYGVRKKVHSSSLELYETLFSDLVILWEGDCEAGFYPALMRDRENCPAEMLSGLPSEGNSILSIAEWFIEAGFQVLAVVDGDKTQTITALFEKKVHFIALPEGKSIEGVIAEELSKKDRSRIAAEILVKAIGASGYIKQSTMWPALNNHLKTLESCYKPVSTDCVLKALNDSVVADLDKSDIRDTLKKHKQRTVFETLAEFLLSEKLVPSLCNRLVEELEKVWGDRNSLGMYQFDDSGELKEYGETNS